MNCGMDPEDCICQAVCDKILPGCGHKCSTICGLKCDPKDCNELREKKCVDCGNAAMVKCCDFENEIECQAKCNVTLACGHKCPGSCSKCEKSLLHVDCKEKCGKQLICGK